MLHSLIRRMRAEIELRPVINGRINRKYDLETCTKFWSFEE